MELAIVGLGRMGRNMAIRLAHAEHQVVVYNRTTERALELAEAETNITAAPSFVELAASLTVPRAVWVMVPSGRATEQTFDALLDAFSPGDVLIG